MLVVEVQGFSGRPSLGSDKGISRGFDLYDNSFVVLSLRIELTCLRSLGGPGSPASCVAQYIRAAGPATRVAGLNPLELVSALLSKI